jgi:hypothetical protein
MQKRRWILTLFLFSVLWTVQAERRAVNTTSTEQAFKNVYQRFDFKGTPLSFDAFTSAYTGYLNLKQAGMLVSDATLSVADFTRSSNQKRFWVLDMKQHKVLYYSLVAHGQGTGEEYAQAFSNTPESHQSSLGFYVTGPIYEGQHGASLKLRGVDGAFNSKAEERAIVIHGADYVSDEFARANQRLGRSYGCPALPNEIAPQVITKIHDGHCLFIYAKQPNYLASSHWLRRKPDGLHDELAGSGLMASTVVYDDNEQCDKVATQQVANDAPGTSVQRIVLSADDLKRLGISKDKIQRQ